MMAFARIVHTIIISSLVLIATARHAPPHKARQHKHEAVRVERRNPIPPLAQPPPGVLTTTTTSTGVLTYITPSPGASPVAVTRQSHIVTSFVPQFTLCELPPIGFLSASPVPISATPSTAPYRNYSISIPSGSGGCTTIYSPTVTMVCATTLTALVGRYTVSQCAQDLTFSTEYGYVLVTPTSAALPSSSSTSSSSSSSRVSTSRPSSARSSSSALTPTLGPAISTVPTVSSISILNGVPVSSSISASSRLLRRQDTSIPSTITPGPSIATLTTYYMAPWTELTAGTPPTDVDLKVCRTFTANDSTECIREYQVWSTSLVTMTTTSVTSVNISTTIHGLSQIIVETFRANITEAITTFSMSTAMDLEFETEWTTTHSSTRHMSTSTGPTVYETMTVAYASATPTAQDTTSTTTIRLTSTIYAGTSTVTISSGSPAMPSVPAATSPPSTSVDFASMLGIGGQ